jgi:hypothetical protein
VSNPQIPLLYGLPRTHKEGNKMRPITSNVDSPFFNLSSLLLNELRHIVGMEGLDVVNLLIIQKVKDVVPQGDEILMSFDVVSQFPSILIEFALHSPEYERMVDNEKNRHSQDFLLCQNYKTMHRRELLQISHPNSQTN